MKVLVVFSALLVVALATPKTPAEKYKDEFAVHKKCQEDPKTAVSDILFNKLTQNEIIENDQLKTHMLCMLQGIGLITTEGKCNEELLKTKWASHFDATTQEKLQKCLVNKETALETSWALMKCQWAAFGDQIKAKTAGHKH